jgi:TRAP-type C4-dicarboxylate transport system substrate-binding protein
MKRTFLTMVIAVLLVASLVIVKSGCAASDKPIELRVATFAPPTHYVSTSVYLPWAKQIEERTQGRVKIVWYWSETLGKAKDQYDMVLNGIADIATVAPGHTPGRFPLTEVAEILPNVPSSLVGSQVVWDLMEKYLMKYDYQGVKMLMACMVDPLDVHINKKDVKTLDALKGLRIRAAGPRQMAWVRAMGASPMQLGPGELYDGLQKGMVDGFVNGFSTLKDFKLNEVTKSHISVGIGASVIVIPMNLKVWNSLPPDVQKVIDEVSGLALSKAEAVALDRTGQLGLEEAKKLGHSVVSLTTAERKILSDKAKPIVDTWIADMEKKGLPGKQVYEDALVLLKKYSDR